MSRPGYLASNTWSWRAYNEALKRRGALAIWFDPEISREGASGLRGWQQTYSAAVECT